MINNTMNRMKHLGMKSNVLYTPHVLSSMDMVEMKHISFLKITIIAITNLLPPIKVNLEIFTIL